MAALVWDQVGDRLYETGVSKGVLYKEDGFGVPWNGLISVQQNTANSVESVHFDGIKFNDIVTIGDFAATMTAFTYPEEFLYYEGVMEDRDGFYIMNQPQSKFSLSYKTLIGNDIDGDQHGYKIHLLYNLTAVPSERNFQSIGEEIEPINFEWNITSIPEDIDNYLPTAHIVIDSRKINPHLLQDIEDILYGNEIKDSYLPALKGLATYIQKWDRLIITEYEDGTWTAETQYNDFETLIMLDETTFQITADTAIYLDAVTYEVSSTNANEEDIWQP